jgi:hypothetical protein
MILSLRPGFSPAIPGHVPQRRRVVVIGATDAGVSAAFHLGVQALLLEQRDVNTAGQGVTRAELQALVAASSSSAETVAAKRWDLPQLTESQLSEEAVPTHGTWTNLLSALGSLTSAEMRLGVRVTAIYSDEHRLEVSTGESFVYDKLVSTLRIPDLQTLIVDEKPSRSYSAESWRYWFLDRDIELLDASTQRFWGDSDPQAAGRRVAESAHRAMIAKYSPRMESRPAALFQPRLVNR